MKRIQGFTLIELIVVIVILGILAATALPRFIDFKSDASAAAVQGVAGAINSGSAINYAGKQLSKQVTPTTLSGTDGTVCGSVGGLLATGSLPTGYSSTSISAAASTNCSTAGVVSCAISNTGVSPAVSTTAIVQCY